MSSEQGWRFFFWHKLKVRGLYPRPPSLWWARGPVLVKQQTRWVYEPIWISLQKKKNRLLAAGKNHFRCHTAYGHGLPSAGKWYEPLAWCRRYFDNGIRVGNIKQRWHDYPRSSTTYVMKSSHIQTKLGPCYLHYGCAVYRHVAVYIAYLTSRIELNTIYWQIYCNFEIMFFNYWQQQ